MQHVKVKVTGQIEVEVNWSKLCSQTVHKMIRCVSDDDGGVRTPQESQFGDESDDEVDLVSVSQRSPHHFFPQPSSIP